MARLLQHLSAFIVASIYSFGINQDPITAETIFLIY